MALLGDSVDVIPEGFTWFMSATLQILGVVGLHVCALEVTGEDLLEILPAINCVSLQVVQSGPSHVGQLNEEELDDEEVIICPTHPTCKAVVLQPNTRICLTIVFNDVIWCPERFWETRVTHIAYECLGLWPFWAEVAPILVVMPVVMWVTRAVVGVCALIPPVGLTVHQGLKMPVWIA
jgi:hypothetical protein